MKKFNIAVITIVVAVFYISNVSCGFATGGGGGTSPRPKPAPIPPICTIKCQSPEECNPATCKC